MKHPFSTALKHPAGHEEIHVHSLLFNDLAVVRNKTKKNVGNGSCIWSRELGVTPQ